MYICYIYNYIFYIYVVIRYISHKAAAHFCDAPGTLIRLGVNKANVQVLLSTIPPTKNGRRLTRRMVSIYSKMGHGTWDMLSYVILFYYGILGDFLGYIVTTPRKKTGNVATIPESDFTNFCLGVAVIGDPTAPIFLLQVPPSRIEPPVSCLQSKMSVAS